MGNNQSGCGNRIETREVLRAAEEGNMAWLGEFLTRDINSLRIRSTCGGNSAWHKAAKGSQLDVIKHMAEVIQRYFDNPQSKDLADERYQLLRMGATAKDVIKHLINVPNFKGVTPLMHAASRGNSELVQWLLAYGADVMLRDRVRCQTSLHYAVESGDTECVRIILNAAGDTLVDGVNLVEAGNHAGLSAMHYATYLDHQEVMKVLLSFCANVSAQAEYFDLDWPSVNAGDTPMHVAASKGNVEAIRILLKGYNELSGNMVPDQGVAPRVRDPRAIRNDYGRLAYHVAVRKGFGWLTELLDPAVPVRYLMSGEELDTTTMYGPPRLATIAASMLHQSLVSDLTAIQHLVAQEAEAAAAVSPKRAAQLAAVAAEREKAAAEAAAGAAASAAAAAAAAANAASRSSSRRWSAAGAFLRRAMTASEGGAAQQQQGRRSSPRSTASGDGGVTSPSEDVTPATPASPQGTLSPFASAGQAAGGEEGPDGASSPRSPLTSTQGFGTVAVHLVARAGGGEPAGAVVQCTGPPAEAAEVGSCGLDGKVSPELEGAGGMLLEGLLKNFRWGARVTPVMSRATSSGGQEDSVTCGVCLDATPTARIVPCQHQLCAECALDIVKRYSMSAAVCPFCRALVRGFAPTNVDLKCVGRYLAVKQQQERQQQEKQNQQQQELQQHMMHRVALH